MKRRSWSGLVNWSFCAWLLLRDRFGLENEQASAFDALDVPGNEIRCDMKSREITEQTLRKILLVLVPG